MERFSVIVWLLVLLLAASCGRQFNIEEVGEELLYSRTRSCGQRFVVFMRAHLFLCSVCVYDCVCRLRSKTMRLISASLIVNWHSGSLTRHRRYSSDSESQALVVFQECAYKYRC